MGHRTIRVNETYLNDVIVRVIDINYRRGSTKQELKGAPLHNFLLRTLDSWERQSVAGATLDDSDEEIIKSFVQRLQPNCAFLQTLLSHEMVTLFLQLVACFFLRMELPANQKDVQDTIQPEMKLV